MKVAGIIAEFNPFHNGHKYLIEQTKKHAADMVIVIMSGSFVQRGDIAITDKWTRTKSALSCGADLVLELPVIYSLNTAQKFAYGAVKTLDQTGIIDTLAFGSECGNTETLKSIAQLTSNEPPHISEKIKNYISSGMNYPLARRKAYSEISNSHVLDTPNDILGIEYIRAVLDIKSNIEPLALKRTGTDHDSTITTNSIASASQIRKMLANGENTSQFTPQNISFTRYDKSLLDSVLIYKLRTSSPEYIKNINDVAEGLENKFIKAAETCTGFDDVCEFVKSKRYTMSRIRRIAWSIVLDLSSELCSKSPSYIRVLGMNENGKLLLRQMKKTAGLPIITKAADYVTDDIFNANNRAEDIFSLCSLDLSKRTAGNDIRTSPIIL